MDTAASSRPRGKVVEWRNCQNAKLHQGFNSDQLGREKTRSDTQRQI